MPKHQNIVTTTANNVNIANYPKFNKLFPFADKSKEQEKSDKDKHKRIKDEKYNTMIRNTKNEDDYKMKGNKGDDTKRSNTSKNNLKRCKSSEQISHN